MYRICKTIKFCGAHQLEGHEGKCAGIHGHNYVAQIFIESKHLDKVGRVIDFSVIKREIKTWIDNNWDHKMIELPGNSTAERMAEALYILANSKLTNGVVAVTKVRIYETDDSYAEFF